MVKKELYMTRNDGVRLYRSYSDLDFKIQKVGTEEIYDEAIDVETATFEYVETNIKIVHEEEMRDEKTEKL